MKDKMNKIHQIDCKEFMKQVPDNYFDLVYIDPPYFEVKGEFDFIWETFDDYLEWIESLAVEFKRILSDKGSLYLWGHAKKIAYKQIIFDKYFNLENHIVWEKTVCQTKIGIDNFRSYAPIKEHILFYSQNWDLSSLDEIMFNKENFKDIKDYLKEEKEKVKKHFNFSSLEFNNYTLSLGCSTTPYKNWFCNTGFWEMATKENYELLQKSGFFKKPYSDLRKEYEDLRKEYEDLRRPFNNSYRLEDVMRFDQEANITGKYNHPTQKPPKLSKALISTSTNKDSKVFIPFIGSGVEAEQCISLGLEWCGCELDKDYCITANKRLKKVQGSLF